MLEKSRKKNIMKLATHNTMTYQKPKQWWARLIPFIAKCQRVDYKKQHELGAEGFDLRIFWDNDGNIEYRHGIYRYSADNLYEVLDYARDNNIIVRVLFELRSYNEKFIKNVELLKRKFMQFCADIEREYPTIQFYGGVATGSCEQLYKFHNEPQINEIGMYSSVTSLFVVKKDWLKIIDDWCPFLYAKLMNKQNIEEYMVNDDNTYLVLDFIDIQ